MSRFAPLALLPLALTLAYAPTATAQDGCTQAQPCPWYVDVREDGLWSDVGGHHWNVTQGDWFTLNATNEDRNGVAHTLTLDGYNVTLRVGAFDVAGSPPFAWTRTGTFTLRNDDGHAATVTVFAGDVNDVEQGLASGAASGTHATSKAGGATSASSPSPVAALVAVGLLAAAASRRRR